MCTVLWDRRIFLFDYEFLETSPYLVRRNCLCKQQKAQSINCVGWYKTIHTYGKFFYFSFTIALFSFFLFVSIANLHMNKLKMFSKQSPICRCTISIQFSSFYQRFSVHKLVTSSFQRWLHLLLMNSFTPLRQIEKRTDRVEN
jgi:hypothetical protein